MSVGGIGVVWCPKCGPIYAAADVPATEPVGPHAISHSIDFNPPPLQAGGGDAIICSRCRGVLEPPACIRWLGPIIRQPFLRPGRRR